MGRPRHKRRAVVSHYNEKTMKGSNPNGQSRLASVGLQSLVLQQPEIDHNVGSPTHLQHIWAPIREAEIPSVAALSLQDMKVDDFGVAWLLRGNSDEVNASKGHVLGEDVLGTHDVTLAKTGTTSFSACDGTLQAELQRLRTQFSDIPSRVFKRIRSSCNPAEALRSGPFLNRSAMKLANIDAISDLAQPVGTRKRPLLFADLCGGPGGFSEYILRRRRHLALSARGWGISLRGRHTPTPVSDHSNDDGMQRFEHDAIEQAEGEVVRSGQGGRILDECRLDEAGRKQRVDPCEWKLDQLSPWCDELFLENHREGQSVDSTGSSPRARSTPSRKGGRQSSLESDVGENMKYRSRVDTRRESGIGLVTSSACRQTKEFARQEERGGGVVDSAAPSGLKRMPHSAAPPDARSCQMTIDYGPDGTGDLTNLNNMRGFVEGVLSSTGGERLDLVVADGGFLEARDTLEQDQVLSPLVYCETLAALLLLGEGGTFVCKLFEVWNEPTASLVYVLHRMFERVAILKPITSRPASSERYILCKGLVRTGLKCKLMDYLESRIHDLLGASGDNLDHREAELGIPSQMKKDRAFMSYLRVMNDRLTKAQVKACVDILLGLPTSGSGGPQALEGGKVRKPKSEPAGSREADALARKMFYDAWRLHGVG